MKDWFSILVRVLFTFVAFAVLQYKFYYPVLAIGGLLGGLFVLKATDDRPLGLGLIIGSVLFGIFAFAMERIYGVN
jgi:hypothetical protein